MLLLMGRHLIKIKLSIVNMGRNMTIKLTLILLIIISRANMLGARRQKTVKAIKEGDHPDRELLLKSVMNVTWKLNEGDFV